MRLSGCLNSILMIMISTVIFGQTVRKDVKAMIDMTQRRFLKEFGVTYVFPENENILDVSVTNIDFSQTSVIIRLSAISNNSFSITVKDFETTNFKLPPIAVKTVYNNKTNDYLTPEFPVNQNPLDLKISNMAPIEDIFVIRDFTLIYIIIAALALIASAVFLFIMFLKKKDSGSEDTISNKTVDPYEEARESLNRLKDIELNKSNAKEIFAEISEVIRRFIERVFRMNALEMATSEIIERFVIELKSNPALSELNEILVHIFKICDRVKFAKFMPEEEHRRSIVEESFDFINTTQTIFSKQETSQDQVSTVELNGEEK